MSLPDRIAARIKALGTTARAISLEIGPNTHLVQAILSGKTQNPRIDTLQKLAAALKTNTEWLVNGVGDPDQPDNPAIAEVINLLPRLDAARRAQLVDYARFLAAQKEK